MKIKKGMRALSLLMVMALLGAMFVPAVSAEENSNSDQLNKVNNPSVIIGDYTNIYNVGVTDLSTLKASEIKNPEELTIPRSLKEYDVVSFEIPSINSEVKDTSSLPIIIDSTHYTAKLKAATFENIDDGIDSYIGYIDGISDSEILLTISDNVIVGSISLNGETYYIKPVEPRYRISKEQPVYHIIYSSKDVLQEKPIKIDDGPVDVLISDKETLPDKSNSYSNINKDSTSKSNQWETVNILIATDNQFYTQESNWKATAQDIINTANSQNVFGRNDIRVSLCVMKYDDSKRIDLSNDPNIAGTENEILTVFKNNYDNSYLNSRAIDIALYLGGYDSESDAQGASWGFGNGNYWGQWAWAQMVADGVSYWGSVGGRRNISIHELGHIFNAHHQNTGGTNNAYEWWDPLPKHTVMWSYFIEGVNMNEFSSPNYHGDATHDNALAIKDAKSTVAGYRYN